jgi:hypothetical protein
MSLEWARARALQQEIQLRRLIRSADGAAWTELSITAHCGATIWVAPAAARLAIGSQPQAASAASACERYFASRPLMVRGERERT